MIVITGAAGFIGSVLAGRLNREGIDRLVLVDIFTDGSIKEPNTLKKNYHCRIQRMQFFDWFTSHHADVEFVFHLGARTNTAEFNKTILNELNLHYSQRVWELCSQYRIPLIYASSAATYGMGEYGYTDSHDVVPLLKPLNPYGESKNEFDKWVLQQPTSPPFWAGMKFFNVFGPNEYHKGRMASVVFHAFNQIRSEGCVTLFRSHNPRYKDGEQLRDFIYVADVADVLMFMMRTMPKPGIYNLGTGHARSFIDLAKAVFHAMTLPVNVSYIDTPEDIRDKYQYFTQAEMQKLRQVGYTRPFTQLEDAIADYVVNYLLTRTCY